MNHKKLRVVLSVLLLSAFMSKPRIVRMEEGWKISFYSNTSTIRFGKEFA